MTKSNPVLFSFFFHFWCLNHKVLQELWNFLFSALTTFFFFFPGLAWDSVNIFRSFFFFSEMRDFISVTFEEFKKPIQLDPGAIFLELGPSSNKYSNEIIIKYVNNFNYNGAFFSTTTACMSCLLRHCTTIKIKANFTSIRVHF